MVSQFIENKNRELKREYTNNILKTISAFANYEGGVIIVGFDEVNNQIVGVENYVNVKLNIENTINDTITPRPRYEINVLLEEGKYMLEIVVHPGKNKPYLYRGVAYQRNDTSTVPVDQMSLVELSLRGRNFSYDQLESEEQKLNFNILEKKLEIAKKTTTLDENVLKTLELYDGEKYNVAAQLLADKNKLDSTGIDIVRLGSNISQFVDRLTITKESILIQYDKALEMFLKHYPEIDVIEGFERVKKQPIPYEAFREAIANAIAHRNYLINAYIKVEMYDNRVEIISPGGLPRGITKEDYLKDNLSISRNAVVSNVLHTLKIIERFGTGIKRINDAYFDYDVKPIYIIKDTFIKIILPNVLFSDKNMKDENRVLNLMSINVEIKRQDVENLLDITKAKAIELLNELINKRLIESHGSGKNTVYRKL